MDNMIFLFERNELNENEHVNANKKIKLSQTVDTEEGSCPNTSSSQSTESDEDLQVDENKRNNSDLFDFKHYRGSAAHVLLFSDQITVKTIGACKLQILQGGLNCFGYDFKPGKKIYNIFSLRGSPLLQFNYLPENTYMDEKDIKKIIGKCGLEANIVQEIKDNYLISKYTIICCYPISDNWLEYIKKTIPVHIMPKIDKELTEDDLNKILKEFPDSNYLKIGDGWNTLIDYHKSDQKIMICGGKGVGKSTLLRFMINKFLNYHHKLYVIDLDPGQAEFTLSGCISIICIENPIFGPNYTTLQTSIRSISQNIDVSFSPTLYLDGIKSLVETYETLKNYPTLINMVGYHRGLGLEITCSAIAIINPSILVEIRSEMQQQNYKNPLVKTTVSSTCSWYLKDFNSELTYDYISIMSVSHLTGFTPAAYLKRNISTVSYFGRTLDRSLTLSSGYISMFKIQLNEIIVIDKEFKPIETSIKEAVINANIVALCSTEDNIVFESYGYGIVRSIVENELYLITPIQFDVIVKVTHFMIGLVEIPSKILEGNEPFNQSIPYFSKGSLSILKEKPRRNFLPRK